MSLFDELGAENRDNQEGHVRGILLGEVKENWDSEHPGMVKVKLLLAAEEKDELDWIPVASPYAGGGYGAYLLPEVGDQVIVAFHMGQSRSPYVIGSLYHQGHALPPGAADEKNTVKIFCTKGGNCIVLRDEEGKENITVKTKAEHTIELDDENQKISIRDKENKNSIVLSAKDGTLTFSAEKRAVFSVGGKEMLVLDGDRKEAALKADSISAQAGQKLALKGQNTSLEGSSTTIKGQNIKAEAQAGLTLKGTASLKAESSGIFQAKGSVMKLN